MIRLPCLTILAGLAAHPAAARCPATPADAATGIDVVYGDGSTARIKIDPEGLSRTEITYNNGSNLGELVIGKHGYLTTQMWALQDGVMTTGAVMMRDFPVAVLARPPIAAGETQEVAATSHHAEVSFDDRLVIAAGPDKTVTIGDCTLRVRDVSVTLATMEPPEVETYQFLADVGLAVLVSISGGTAPELVLEPANIAVAD